MADDSSFFAVPAELFYAYDGPQPALWNRIFLPIASAISICLVIAPLSAFVKSQNVPNASLCAIVLILLFKTTLNAILWQNDDWEHWFYYGTGVCDVEQLILFPMTLAFNLALLRIFVKLSSAVSMRAVAIRPSKAMEKRSALVDLLFCWALPFVQLPLQYLIMIQRYSIVPVVGCAPMLDIDWVYVILIYIWPLICTAATLLYAGLLGWRLVAHRRQISSTIRSNGSTDADRRFWKVMVLSSLIWVIYLPGQILFAIDNWPTPPFNFSWSAIHWAHWKGVFLVHTADASMLQYEGWAYVVAALIFFVFYGQTEESRAQHHAILRKLGLDKWVSYVFDTSSAKIQRSNSYMRLKRWLQRLNLVKFLTKLFRGYELQEQRNAEEERKKKELEQRSFTSSSRLYSSSHSTTGLKSISDEEGQKARDIGLKPSTHPSKPSNHHNFISRFRTTARAPFFGSGHSSTRLLSSKPSISAQTTITTSTEPDLEQQDSPTHLDPTRSGLTKDFAFGDAAVETSVWAERSRCGVPSGTRYVDVDHIESLPSHSRGSKSMDFTEIELGPLSTRGTRESRERERREMEAGAKVNSASVADSGA